MPEKSADNERTEMGRETKKENPNTKEVSAKFKERKGKETGKETGKERIGHIIKPV